MVAMSELHWVDEKAASLAGTMGKTLESPKVGLTASQMADPWVTTMAVNSAHKKAVQKAYSWADRSVDQWAGYLADA